MLLSGPTEGYVNFGLRTLKVKFLSYVPLLVSTNKKIRPFQSFEGQNLTFVRKGRSSNMVRCISILIWGKVIRKSKISRLIIMISGLIKRYLS